jgi:hypothetical protein
VLWLGGPTLVAITVLIAGLLVRRHSPVGGFVLLVLGSTGLVISLVWVAFAFYVDSVLGDT